MKSKKKKKKIVHKSPPTEPKWQRKVEKEERKKVNGCYLLNTQRDREKIGGGVQ